MKENFFNATTFQKLAQFEILLVLASRIPLNNSNNFLFSEGKFINEEVNVTRIVLEPFGVDEVKKYLTSVLNLDNSPPVIDDFCSKLLEKSKVFCAFFIYCSNLSQKLSKIGLSTFHQTHGFIGE